jgi:hypothetical protein
MKLNLELGETEHNRLEYSFNQLLGTSIIKVNQQVVVKKTRWFSEPLHQIHELDVGSHEIWHVRIESERKLLLGHRCRVFVNQRLTRVCEGI